MISYKSVPKNMQSKTDDQITLSALKFLCGEYKHICRLCLRFTNNKICLDDTVAIQASYCNNDSITYYSMLEYLNVLKEPLLPQILCESCADITINSYIFLKLRQFAIDKWNNVLNILSMCLSQSNSIESSSQTAYLMLTKNDNLLLQSCKNYDTKPKKVAVLKDIMSCCRKYIQKKRKLREFQCDECEKRFSCHDYLTKHKKLHNRSPNPCPKCLKVFLTKTQLAEHMERLHYPKTIQCSKCSRKFGTQKTLKAHQKMHHTPTSCKVCNINFPSRLELRTHIDKHGTPKCERCNKKFSSQHTYKVHLKNCGENGKIKEKYICDFCSKCYSSKNGLITHLNVDHGFAKKVITCKWCYKKFDAISRLNNHIVTHTKEKKFHCEQCGGRFVTQAALTYHVRLHTGERPYPCDMCDESFLSSSRRMEHKKRKHIGPTKECSLCEMKFLTQFQLRKHIKRHFNPSSKLYITETDNYFPKRVRQPHLFKLSKNESTEN